MMATTAQTTVKWRHILPAVLRGEGLAPYPASGFSALFDWSERPNAGSRHVKAYEGQFLIDVVEIEDNAVHQPSKPADEIVCVLNGVLTLTTDGIDREQAFRKGEFVLIPAGWAGVYRVGSEDGPFRELCIVPHDYFDPATVSPPSGLVPRPVCAPEKPGSDLLLDTRYTIEAVYDDAMQDTQMALNTDAIVRVLTGTLTLDAGDESASFDAGTFLVLPKGFHGNAKTSPGFRALIARWLGGD